jgi:2-polyprenyl-3-methyl-5-hydroxy-6-metoxy-1,4-benzoquinol methylase
VEPELVHSLELRTPDGHPLQGGYDVVSCGRCGTGYADVAVDQRVYDRYYAERAKYAADTATVHGVSAEPAWVRARFDEAAARISAHLPRPARIVDIGCSTGSLLGALRRRGYADVVGVDPSPACADTAWRLHGAPVHVGTLRQLPEGIGTFDCVCLTGVLEHVWDLDGAMAAIMSLLRPGGAVYVEVPDASRYLDPFISPFEDFHTEHVNHFSAVTLAVLGARFGLETVWSGAADNDIVPGATAAVAAVCWRRGCGTPFAGRDPALVASLRAFTAQSRDAWQRMDDALRADLGGSPDFVLWGIGELSVKLLASTVLAERSAAALVDGNASRHGLRFDGLEVRSPRALPPGAAPIVIGSFLRVASIRASIEALGLPNRVVTLSAPWAGRRWDDGWPRAGAQEVLQR